MDRNAPEPVEAPTFNRRDGSPLNSLEVEVWHSVWAQLSSTRWIPRALVAQRAGRRCGMNPKMVVSLIKDASSAGRVEEARTPTPNEGEDQAWTRRVLPGTRADAPAAASGQIRAVSRSVPSELHSDGPRAGGIVINMSGPTAERVADARVRDWLARRGPAGGAGAIRA